MRVVLCVIVFFLGSIAGKLNTMAPIVIDILSIVACGCLINNYLKNKEK